MGSALLYLIFLLVMFLINPHLRTASPSHPLPTWLQMSEGAVSIATIATSLLAIGGVARRSPTGTAVANALTAGLAGLAVLLAGRRRAYVKEAWDSDLQRPRDPADGPDVPALRKAAYAAGLVKAAVRYHVDDAGILGGGWRTGC